MYYLIYCQVNMMIVDGLLPNSDNSGQLAWNT